MTTFLIGYLLVGMVIAYKGNELFQRNSTSYPSDVQETMSDRPTWVLLLMVLFGPLICAVALPIMLKNRR